jgi:hypothetical protein
MFIESRGNEQLFNWQDLTCQVSIRHTTMAIARCPLAWNVSLFHDKFKENFHNYLGDTDDQKGQVP